MSITLELNPHVEARLRTEAERQGKPLSQYLNWLLEGAWRTGDPAPQEAIADNTQAAPDEAILETIKEMGRLQSDIQPAISGDSNSMAREARGGRESLAAKMLRMAPAERSALLLVQAEEMAPLYEADLERPPEERELTAFTAFDDPILEDCSDSPAREATVPEPGDNNAD